MNALPLASILLMASPASGEGSFVVSHGGVSDCVIVLAEDTIPPERTAATELQSHLEEVTGARLPICHESVVPDGVRNIMVGPTEGLKVSLPDLDLSSLGQDGIVLKTVGDTLFLAGGRPRGTLYAVYTFLEDVVGCRWWTSTESYVPKVPTLEIPALDTVYVPPLRYREAFYRDAFHPVFGARLRCNGHFERIPPHYGGHYTILGWCHTFFQLLPPDEHFEAHPEWYSEIDGKRVRDGQLCLTNQSMAKALTEKALEWIRKSPDAGIISISQNDRHRRCQCAPCLALEEAEGSPSGPLLHLVNTVAEGIEKEFPEVLVYTLAYSYTRQAPRKVKPRRNVVIRLCSIECSYVQTLAEGPQNETFKRDIEAWSAIAPRLTIWNYVTNFRNYLFPHPNLRVLAPNLRFFVRNNAIGLFEQGGLELLLRDFVRLRAWVLGHLLWDPEKDEKKLVQTFLQGYYGPAAEHIQQYLDTVHDAAERSDVYLRCYMDDTSAWFPLKDVIEATRHLDAAEKAVAGDPVLAERVSRDRMPMDLVWLMRYDSLKRQAETTGQPFLGPEDPKAAVESFIAKAHSFDVGSFREGGPFQAFENKLKGLFRDPAPRPKGCEDLRSGDFIDIQDNRFRLHGYGRWSAIVPDERASDGMAVRMPGEHHQWAVQYPITSGNVPEGAWRCHVVIRCETKAKEGSAFQVGLYHQKEGRGVVVKTIPIQEVSHGQYHTVDLGEFELEDGMYFWVAPMGDPKAVSAVLVDRIYLMR